jgi:4-hydroxy-3-polyprenylbenzoate decarboxylase
MNRLAWRDTRDWLTCVDALGELRTVRGASWQEDIGEVTALLDHTEGSPCVLFDDIPGYPSGRRVLVNANGTMRRQAVTLGLPPEETTHQGLLAFWRRALAGLTPVPPREVAGGPVCENVLEHGEVDLEAFPAPVWHPGDGGRYLGTASLNFLRDPDSAWVNAATYRNMVFGPDTLGMFISPGKHGRLIREKYFARGQRCPVVVMVGADPLLFMAACSDAPGQGMDELAWAGAVRGSPVEVIRGRHTGLPIPAHAEVAVEGWMDPDETHAEGPYGEWMGYYAGGSQTTPVIHVQAIYHRDDPIILGCPQGKPPHEDNRFAAYLRSAAIEQQLRAAGVADVSGVWCPPEAGDRLLVVVAIRQAYAGHATQVAHLASQCGAAAYAGRLVVVVDDDIDIFSLRDVLWAITTRCDPQRDVTIVPRAWSSTIDPAVHPDERPFNSRLLLDATRPWEWRDRFPKPVWTGELERAAREKWSWILEPRGGYR